MIMLNASVDNELNVSIELQGKGDKISNELLNVYKAVMETIFEELDADIESRRILLDSMSRAIGRFHAEWLKDGE